MLGFDLSTYGFGGHSLLQAMETGDSSQLLQHVVCDGKPDKPESLLSIRSAGWELFVDEADGSNELYDLENDLCERTNGSYEIQCGLRSCCQATWPRVEQTRRSSGARRGNGRYSVASKAWDTLTGRKIGTSDPARGGASVWIGC